MQTQQCVTALGSADFRTTRNRNANSALPFQVERARPQPETVTGKERTMLYDDRLLPSHIAKQARLQTEYKQENQCEWTEQQPGQPLATLHSRFSHFYGVAKLFCAHCGTPFYCDAGSYHKGRKYCSARCTNDAYIARRDVRRQAARDKTCPVCGTRFRAERKDRAYCSDACKQKQYRMNRNESEVNPT